MDFVTTTEQTRLVDPSGAEVEQVIEHRTDPLTSAVASINTALGEKAKAFLGAADLDLLRDLEERSRAGCPFCHAGEKGTRYPRDFAPEGQLRIGTSLAMPNLFSKCRHDSVVILDPSEHVLLPSRLSKTSLGHAVAAAAELVRRTRAQDASLVHHVAGMNFLHPGGSSVPHAHFQVHVRTVPYSAVARLVHLGAERLERTGRSHWEALLDAERKLGARYLGAIGRVEWVAAFAPSRQREIWGLLPGASSLAEITDADAAAFADGISRVVSFYEECGTHPFTLAFLSSPGPGARHHALQVRIGSRPALRALYANYDTWFGPLFAGDEVHTAAPEDYAARLRARW